MIRGLAPAVLLTFGLAVFPAAVSAAARPNVLVILTDDQGWGDLGLNGNRNLNTPKSNRN